MIRTGRDSTIELPLLGATRQITVDLAVVVLATALYTWMASGLFDWIIDDAGITFSYARNLAQGHGLVPQPGVEPIEGYSNPLWVLFWTPFFLIGLFDPYILPKIVSIVLVFLTYFVLHRLIVRLTESRFAISLAVLILLSINTSWVAWTSSGLENPLFALLIAVLLWLCVMIQSEQAFRPVVWGLVAGLVSGGIALSRPDGIVYAWLFPLALVILPATAGIARRLFAAGAYIVGLLATAGVYQAFRLSYFGEWVPNTYYVKGGPDRQMVADLLMLTEPYREKLVQISGSVMGQSVWMVVPAIIVGMAVWVIARQDNWRPKLLLVGFTITALGAYLILTLDWMGEYRFATPFFMLIWVAMVCFTLLVVRSLVTTRGLRTTVGLGLLIVALALSVIEHQPRRERFEAHRVTDFNRVKAAGPDRFNAWNEYFGWEDATLLTPDLGATLFYSDIRIYDLAGLCDPVIPRKRRWHQQEFYDYVFDSIQPTIINTWGSFTGESKFDDDPRFLQDYVGVNAHIDEYVKRVYKTERLSGVFIRKDALAGREAKLDSLRQGLAP
ncbi:hypothetical protein GF356_13290 [candidate division GN15 bacterium]|nr:hypothetical protein [candidate division GN15 bacterium]